MSAMYELALTSGRPSASTVRSAVATGLTLQRGQRVLLVVELLVPKDLPLSERDHDVDTGAHVRGARPPAPMLDRGDKDPVPVVAHALYLDAVLLKVPEPPGPGFVDPVVTAVGAAVGPAGILDPFDLRIADLGDHLAKSGEQRLLVEALGSGEEVREEVQVLLGHRFKYPRAVATRRAKPCARAAERAGSAPPGARARARRAPSRRARPRSPRTTRTARGGGSARPSARRRRP